MKAIERLSTDQAAAVARKNRKLEFHVAIPPRYSIFCRLMAAEQLPNDIPAILRLSRRLRAEQKAYVEAQLEKLRAHLGVGYIVTCPVPDGLHATVRVVQVVRKYRSEAPVIVLTQRTRARLVA